MFTRHFGGPPRGLVRTSEFTPEPPPTAVHPLLRLWSLVRTKMRPKARRRAKLSPIERRKLFKVVDGGKS